MKEIFLGIRKDIDLFDELEPIERFICVLFLVNQMKEVLEEIVRLVCQGEKGGIFFH